MSESIIESHIEDLERKLALKKAYLGLDLKFPKGTKTAIKEEITARIKELCELLASDLEASVKTNAESFSEAEITALRAMAAKIMAKSSNLPVKASKRPTPSKKPQGPRGLADMIATGQTKDVPKQQELAEEAPSKGTLLTLDGIDPTIRQSIMPQAEVNIIRAHEDKYLVTDETNRRFLVPQEDVAIDY